MIPKEQPRRLHSTPPQTPLAWSAVDVTTVATLVHEQRDMQSWYAPLLSPRAIVHATEWPHESTPPTQGVPDPPAQESAL